jgi:AcrR family transcriptional regulator
MRLSRIHFQVMRSDRVAYHVTVSRWAPNARERLIDAALYLFVENGYEETTVAQIADRAGVNRATFFRHFADKREVLFSGEDVLAGLFADAVRAAPAGATLAECLQAVLAAAAVTMTPQLRAAAARRLLVIAANSELQERGLLKHARVAKSVTAALRERGTDELTARLGAELVMLAFSVAFERWMKGGDDELFRPFADAALSDLQASAGELVLSSPDKGYPSADPVSGEVPVLGVAAWPTGVCSNV